MTPSGPDEFPNKAGGRSEPRQEDITRMLHKALLGSAYRKVQDEANRDTEEPPVPYAEAMNPKLTSFSDGPPEPPLKQSYWVVPVRFLAGEYPRTLDEKDSHDRLSKMLESRLTFFVDLTHPKDDLKPYAYILQNIGHGTAVHSCKRRCRSEAGGGLEV